MLSVAAGADLLCIGADNSVEQVRAIQAALVDAVRSGRLAEERLAEAAKAVARPRCVRAARKIQSTVADVSEALAAGAARSVTVSGRAAAAGRRPGGAGRLGRDDRHRRAPRGGCRPTTWSRRGRRRCRRAAGAPGPRRAPAARRAGHAGRRAGRLGRGGVGLARSAYRRPADHRRAGLVPARRGGRDRRAQEGRVGPVSREQSIGLDIGATKTLGVLVDADGRVLEQVREATEPGAGRRGPHRRARRRAPRRGHRRLRPRPRSGWASPGSSTSSAARSSTR